MQTLHIPRGPTPIFLINLDLIFCQPGFLSEVGGDGEGTVVYPEGFPGCIDFGAERGAEDCGGEEGAIEDLRGVF